MSQTKEYLLDGFLIKVPLRCDEQTGILIEDYREFIENPKRTPNGYPIMFAGEDACSLAEEETAGGCPDCGSCRFYKRAGEHTWIGICKNEKNSNSIPEKEEK